MAIMARPVVHRRYRRGKIAAVPIDFHDLLGNDGWVSLPGAPGMSSSTRIDPAFNLQALRGAPNVTVGWHHNNLRELVIVFGGEFAVTYDSAGSGEERRVVGAGEFWISDAGTAHTMTAGPDGVTYLATWPQPVADPQTTWHRAR